MKSQKVRQRTKPDSITESDPHWIGIDAKHQGSPRYFYTIVTFEDAGEIDRLIDGLKQLRSGKIDHLHIVDRNLKPGSLSLAEVVLRLRRSINEFEKLNIGRNSRSASFILKQGMKILKEKQRSRLSGASKVKERMHRRNAVSIAHCAK